jgi:hypothetical protein
LVADATYVMRLIEPYRRGLHDATIRFLKKIQEELERNSAMPPDRSVRPDDTSVAPTLY